MEREGLTRHRAAILKFGPEDHHGPMGEDTVALVHRRQPYAGNHVTTRCAAQPMAVLDHFASVGVAMQADGLPEPGAQPGFASPDGNLAKRRLLNAAWFIVVLRPWCRSTAHALPDCRDGGCRGPVSAGAQPGLVHSACQQRR